MAELKKIRHLAMDESGTEDENRYYFYREMGYDFVDREYVFIDPSDELQNENKTLVVIYGLSGSGKTPTIKTIKSRGLVNFYEPPVIKSWECRPNGLPRDKEDEELWYDTNYFLPQDSDIEKLSSNPRYLTTKFRNHCQAFDLENVLNCPNSLAFRDLYYTFIPGLKKSSYLDGKVKIKTIFFSPFGEEEIKAGLGKDSFRAHVCSKMSQLLALRSCEKKRESAYSQEVMHDNEVRAITAYDEIEASRFADYIIQNPFPEGHPAWGYVNLSSQESPSSSRELIDVVRKVEQVLME